MNLNRKKLVAREFLILMVCAMVFGVAYIGTLPYNYLVNSEIDNFKKKSQFLKDSIETITQSFSYKIDKQKWFFDESEKLNATGNFNTYEELWERLEYLEKADSIEYKWKKVWPLDLKEIIQKIGFSNEYQFEQFIKSNSLSTHEIDQNNSVISLKKELDKINSRISTKKHKILNTNEKNEFAFACLAFFGILFFPLRYLFYAVRWSFKTIKQKE